MEKDRMDGQQVKEVTIYDIAKALNISAATVSRSLSDNNATSAKTKEKVLAVAEAMGYRFNASASSLRRNRSQVIGVMVPRLNSHFIAEVIAGIEIAVNKANYTLMVSQSLEMASHEIANTRMMSSNRVAGVLASLSGDTTDISHFRELAGKGVPVILFDRVIKEEGWPTIIIDNYKAGYEITAHLAGQGYKRIMHVTAGLASNVYLERYNGYRQALADHGLTFTNDLLKINTLSSADGRDIAKLIVEMEDRPDGVFFTNDNCAVNCMVQLQELGLTVPDNVAVAGFNNDPVTTLVTPKLTTISYNGFEIGTAAATLLLQRLTSGNRSLAPESITLASGLIVRGSTIRIKLPNNSNSY